MPVNEQGWIDWAEDDWGPDHKVNGGVNAVRGVFLHSAEGFEPGIRNILMGPAQKSWHATVEFNGKCRQHYSLLEQCWHATAANNNYVGIEFEGKVPANPTLTEAQVLTAQRLVKDISEWQGWVPKRPTYATDISHTLWEHNEVVRLGGDPSACPSGRIPWNRIVAMPVPPNAPVSGLIPEGNFVVLYNSTVPVWRWGSTDGGFPGRVSKNFGGTWWWLRHDFATGRAYWSLTEGD